MFILEWIELFNGIFLVLNMMLLDWCVLFVVCCE